MNNNNKDFFKKILEKLNNIDNKFNNKPVINESHDLKHNFLKEISKPTFGKNVKFKEEDIKNALEDYYNYIVWNGLKFRDKAISEISNKYNLSRNEFVEILKKKNLYDMQIPYSALKENSKKFNIRDKLMHKMKRDLKNKLKSKIKKLRIK